MGERGECRGEKEDHPACGVIEVDLAKKWGEKKDEHHRIVITWTKGEGRVGTVQEHTQQRSGSKLLGSSGEAGF